MGEDAAGLDRHREIDRIDRADPVHPAKGEDDVVAILGRNPAANQAGIAALRHDRQLSLGANPHHRCDLGGRCRADDEAGGAVVEPPRLDEIRLLVMRVGNPPDGPPPL